MLSLLEPDNSQSHDLVWEVSAGLNLGSWARARLTLEVERRDVSRNTPQVFGALSPVADRTAFLAQMGAAF